MPLKVILEEAAHNNTNVFILSAKHSLILYFYQPNQ